MKIKAILSLAALVVCVGAWAQTTIGTAAEVQGLVTVSEGADVATLQVGRPILSGSRFVTGSNGTATLRLRNNCVVELKPNQMVTVDLDQTCPAIIAAIQSTMTQLAGVTVGSGVGLSSSVVLGTVMGVSLAVAGVAGTGGGPNPATAPGGGGVIPNPPFSSQ